MKRKSKLEPDKEEAKKLQEAIGQTSLRLSYNEQEELADKMLGLPSRNQREFVSRLLHGVDPLDAFEIAYPNTSAHLRVAKTNQLMRHPKIKEIVDQIKRVFIPQRLSLSSWTIAIPALEEVAEAGKSEKAKVQAATKILEFGIGTPPKQIQIQSVNWHGNFDKSFIRDKMREHIKKNLEERGEFVTEGDTIDVEDEYI